MYNPYPLLLPDYENTERQSPYRLVKGKGELVVELA
jgi:hypothetical protein